MNVQAVECFRRALDLRMKFYGKDAIECVSSFYKLGFTLLKLAKSEEESTRDHHLKMSLDALGVALRVVNTQFGDTMEKVHIMLSAFAEASMLSNDFDNACENYIVALSMLQGLVASESQLLAEMYFETAVCMQKSSIHVSNSRIHCERAKTICEAKLETLDDASDRDNWTHGLMKKIDNLLAELDLQEEQEEV